MVYDDPMKNATNDFLACLMIVGPLVLIAGSTLVLLLALI